LFPEGAMAAVFTVFFEDPFWVGVLESEDEGVLSVARHVFGAEPSNAELLAFMLGRFTEMRRSKSSVGEGTRVRATKRKRARRDVARDATRPPSTKAQAALSAARSEIKVERAASSREERLAEAERRFELRSEKRKKKRSGH
jgi:hypothetical protein